MSNGFHGAFGRAWARAARPLASLIATVGESKRDHDGCPPLRERKLCLRGRYNKRRTETSWIRVDGNPYTIWGVCQHKCEGTRCRHRDWSENMCPDLGIDPHKSETLRSGLSPPDP